ncbi:MAG TPA: hypothetical protein DEP28_12370 [Bacteroidetes bacterium]|nr:hypothetical protein [Bacteroidota bacterium]
MKKFLKYNIFMQDKSSYSNNNLLISEGLKNYINAMVEEILLKGETFDDQKKKWLRKYSEAEGVNFIELENNLNLFLELPSETFISNMNLINRIANLCYINKNTLKAIVEKKSREKKSKGKNLYSYIFIGIGLLFIISIVLVFQQQKEQTIFEETEEMIDTSYDPYENVETNTEVTQEPVTETSNSDIIENSKLNREEIISIIESYCDHIFNNRWDELSNIYALKLDTFFHLRNIDKSLVINDHKKHFERWEVLDWKINNNTVSISRANFYNFIQFEMNFTKRKISDGTIFIFTIKTYMTIDENGKISSLNEIILDKDKIKYVDS